MFSILLSKKALNLKNVVNYCLEKKFNHRTKRDLLMLQGVMPVMFNEETIKTENVTY